MTPVHAELRHDPPHSYGDCHRAAVATILDLDIRDVPHFADGGPDGPLFKKREREFLAAIGLVPIDSVYKGHPDWHGPALILHVIGDLNPGVPYILAGADATGENHSVVCLGDRIVHDPSPDKPGIVGPCADGWYWITFFGALRLDRRPRCGACAAPLAADGLCTRSACVNAF